MKKSVIKIRETILVFLTHKIALPMLKLVRKPNEFTYSEDDLQSLPSGTLGNDLFIFLKQRHLPLLKHYTRHDLQSLRAVTLENDLFIFLKQKTLPLLKHYTRHDLKHVLLGYDTTEEGEACLQSFMLGNGRISFPVLATDAHR